MAAVVGTGQKLSPNVHDSICQVWSAPMCRVVCLGQEGTYEDNHTELEGEAAAITRRGGLCVMTIFLVLDLVSYDLILLFAASGRHVCADGHGDPTL